jgi:hypothetical protein
MAQMRSTTRGSVIKEMILIRAPHWQTSGSTSKIFLSNRAQVLRASLEKSAWSFSAPVSAAEPAVSPTADDLETRARLL